MTSLPFQMPDQDKRTKLFVQAEKLGDTLPSLLLPTDRVRVDVLSFKLVDFLAGGLPESVRDIFTEDSIRVIGWVLINESNNRNQAMCEYLGDLITLHSEATPEALAEGFASLARMELSESQKSKLQVVWTTDIRAWVSEVASMIHTTGFKNWQLCIAGMLSFSYNKFSEDEDFWTSFL